MLGFGSVYTGTDPNQPDFAQGWFGYVSRDLLDLLAAHSHRRPGPSAYTKVYCGNGSFNGCRAVLRSTLLAAMSVTPKQMYGYGACASNPQPSCFDKDEWTAASAISLPPFPFQNRPTFQQVVELTRTLPR